jgi:hypothetical protein
MKCAVVFSFLLAGCGVLLGDSPKPVPSSRQPATLLEDLVRMTRAGSSDVTVLAYAKAHRLELPPELSDDNLRWLRDSGVSEVVVAYMTAYDVRASNEDAQKQVAYGPDEGAARPRTAYSSESDDDSYGGGSPDSYVSSYADNHYDAYPGYDYDHTYGGSLGYGYSPYPYFFVDRGGSIRRFHRRDHQDGGHHRFHGGPGFRGPRGDVVGRGRSREAWRDRDFSGRGRSIAVGPRGSGRPAFTRGGFGPGPQGPRGRATGHRGFGPPGPGRGSLPHEISGHRGGASARSGFSHPGFSGGPHTSGGGRLAAGSPGGRGRR